MASDVLELFDRSQATLCFDDGSEIAARALADEGRTLAGWLTENGFARGDRVAAHLPNGVDYVRLLLACAAAGLTAVSVNTRYSTDEVDDLMTRSGARQVTPDSSWRSATPIDTGGADDRFVVFTTSGTTSKPKMVVHRQRSIAQHAADAAPAFALDASTVAMVVMPLCGTFGLTSLMVAVAGDATVVVTNFDVARTAGLIAQRRVEVVNGSDDMFHRLVGHGADLSSIRVGGYGRFNTSLDRVVAEADQAGARLTGLYGMSEVQALFSLRDPHADHRERLRAGGTLVSSDASYRIVDGELQVRGPSLMEGYLAEGGGSIDAALTAEHFDDGWFRTGDLATVDDDRTFEFVARLGDAMRLGGFLVSPVEIESTLTELPGVGDVQVVAVDRPSGARPVAFVIGDVDERAAIEYCRERLAIYKVPVRVISVDEFPTTPSANGTKVQRTKLRDIATAALSAET